MVTVPYFQVTKMPQAQFHTSTSFLHSFKIISALAAAYMYDTTDFTLKNMQIYSPMITRTGGKYITASS